MSSSGGGISVLIGRIPATVVAVVALAAGAIAIPVISNSGPTQTDHCFSDPGACGFPDPDAGNVGVPSGTSLTSSGSITASTPGQVIDGKDVTGGITVSANNVTIQNTRITASGTGCGATSPCGNSIITLTGAYDLTVSHVELTSSGTTVEHAIRNPSGGTLHIDHVYHHGTIDSLCWCGNADISDSYSVIDLAISLDHLENTYSDGHTLTVDHNTFINLQDQTANVFANTGNGGGGPCSNHLTITDNLFAGGGYSIYACGNATSDGTATATITGNRIARCGGGVEVSGGGGSWVCSGGADSNGYFPRGGAYGVCLSLPASAVVSGNVWDDTSTSASSRC